jgi:photosystem II stability/assembly factor-like uncharacterized protein
MKRAFYIYIFFTAFIITFSSCSDDVNPISTPPLVIDTTEQQGWFTQKTNLTKDLRSIYFIDNMTGWIAGDEGTLLKTTNGGNNWDKISLINYYWPKCIFFINNSTGWICGNWGLIIKSTDGGYSWVQQAGNSNFTFRSIRFTDPDTGIAVGQFGKITRTSDGGNLWTSIESGVTFTLHSVFFSTPQKVWVSAKCGGFLSNDAGLHWINYISVCSEQVLFVDQNTGWFSNVTLKTTDGGISWFHTNGLSYDYIAFPSAETGYSCGVTGAITKTIDGGFNWKSPEKYKTRYLNSICFINNSTGWAVGDSGKILKTTTGSN